MSKILFEQLPESDLIVNHIYMGSADGMLSGEPISHVLPGSSNMGGFRIAGKGGQKKWVVLFTTEKEPDWPDSFDTSTGRFVYFGDNREPGKELHDKNGNQLLREVYAQLYDPLKPRAGIAPFFVFKKHRLPNASRSVQFLGLAVPGFPRVPETEDLVAIWKSKEGGRFQNYRATFTILDASVIKRAWIDDLQRGECSSEHAPAEWSNWLATGRYQPLTTNSVGCT